MAMRVAVVGSCASGKTTIVARLREHGIDAWAVAQVHSAIAELWRHLGPDRLVFLDTILETVRARRGDDNWPGWIFDLQQERLLNARTHADVIVDTNDRSVDEIVATILRELELLAEP
jgi:shikimate kinase